MAKKTSIYIEQAKGINTINIRDTFKPLGYIKGNQQSEEAYKANLVNYVQGLSKNLYDRTSRLVKTYKGKETSNPYLNATKEQGHKAIITRITRKQAEKMSINALINKAKELTNKAKNKTMSVTDAKKFEKEFKEDYGVDYKELTTADWKAIKDMEKSGFDSTEAQDVYVSVVTNKDGKVIKESKKFISKDNYVANEADKMSTEQEQGIRDKISNLNSQDGWGNSPYMK